MPSSRCGSTAPRLPDALALLEAWGFAFAAILFVWVKTTSAGKPCFGTGYYTRAGAEIVLLAKRGRGLPVLAHDVPQVVLAPRGRHSEKPAAVHSGLERLFGPVARLEMFARSRREGWTAWGDELEDCQ